MKHLLIIMMLLVTISVIPTKADEQPIFMTGKVAPSGSITSLDPASQSVYIRWGSVEPNWPNEFRYISLERTDSSGNSIILFSAKLVGDVVTESAVGSIYSKPENRRRLAELLDSLVQNDAELWQSDASWALQLANTINADNGQQRAWAELVVGSNFPLAQLMNLGWIDQPDRSDVYRYQLMASEDGESDNERLVGQIEIDYQPDLGWRRLPAILDPVQVQWSDNQCSSLDQFKDHNTVLLNWRRIGEDNPVDRLSATFEIAGVDIYRTTENINADVRPEDMSRDIATESAMVGFDGDGRPLLNGLEKVNDGLVSDHENFDISAPSFKWAEQSAELLAAGLAPGDRRMYYLVPRDFTDNYGETVALVVQVPNKVPPMVPGPIRVITTSTGSTNQGLAERVELRWDHINTSSFLRELGDGYQVCDASPAENGLVSYVEQGDSCDGERLYKSLDIWNYAVYRFDDFETASLFTDADGDGFSDEQESAGGTQCDASRAPTNAQSYEVIASTRLEMVSGVETAIAVDETPALPGNRNKVYWYRVAAFTTNGNSEISAPRRVIFPDRRLPAKPQVTLTSASDQQCLLTGDGAADSVSFINISQSELFCGEARVFTTTQSSLSCSDLKSYQSACGEALTFLGEGQAPSYEGSTCRINAAPLCDDVSPNQIMMPRTAEAANELSFSIRAPLAEQGACVELRTQTGQLYATSCSQSAGSSSLEATVSALEVCGMLAYTVSSSGTRSASAYLPCISPIEPFSENPIDATPRINQVTLNGNNLFLEYMLPSRLAESVVVEATLVSNTGETTLTSVDGGVFRDFASSQIGLGAIPASSLVEACVRVRANYAGSATSQSSDWSMRECLSLLDSGGSDSTLSWPSVPIIDNRYSGEVLFTGARAEYIISTTPASDVQGCGARVFDADQQHIEVGCSSEQALMSALSMPSGLILYRQERASGEWLQVSPLVSIDRKLLRAEDINIGGDKLLPTHLVSLFDPYLRLREVNGALILVLQDRRPRFADKEYRYQLIRLNSRSEPISATTSDWYRGTNLSSQGMTP